jgi:hypothetical protein
MTKDDFSKKIIPFLGSPEHNAYYDVVDILKICLDVMTDDQRKEAFKIVSRKLTKQRHCDDL